MTTPVHDILYVASRRISIQESLSENATSGSAGKARALWSYTAVEDDELTMQAGDIITILEESDDGWWLGRLECNTYRAWESTNV